MGLFLRASAKGSEGAKVRRNAEDAEIAEIAEGIGEVSGLLPILILPMLCDLCVLCVNVSFALSLDFALARRKGIPCRPGNGSKGAYGGFPGGRHSGSDP
jgi:hypothetical protein